MFSIFCLQRDTPVSFGWLLLTWFVPNADSYYCTEGFYYNLLQTYSLHVSIMLLISKKSLVVEQKARGVTVLGSDWGTYLLNIWSPCVGHACKTIFHHSDIVNHDRTSLHINSMTLWKFYHTECQVKWVLIFNAALIIFISSLGLDKRMCHAICVMNIHWLWSYFPSWIGFSSLYATQYTFIKFFFESVY